MKNLYMLKNIRTGVIEYDNLYAQDLIGINKSCISKYEKSKSVYQGRMGHIPEAGAPRHGKSSKKRLAQLRRDDPSWSDTDTGGRGQWQRASYRLGQDRLTGSASCAARKRRGMDIMGNCVTQVSISTTLYTGGSGRTGRKRNIMVCGDMSAKQGIMSTDRKRRIAIAMWMSTLKESRSRHLRKSMGMICGCRSLGEIIWRSKQ